jgi:hypothetical protein
MNATIEKNNAASLQQVAEFDSHIECLWGQPLIYNLVLEARLLWLRKTHGGVASLAYRISRCDLPYGILRDERKPIFWSDADRWQLLQLMSATHDQCRTRSYVDDEPPWTPTLAAPGGVRWNRSAA